MMIQCLAASCLFGAEMGGDLNILVLLHTAEFGHEPM